MAACSLRPAGDGRVPVREEVVKLKSAHEGAVLGNPSYTTEGRAPLGNSGPKAGMLKHKDSHCGREYE